jgi:[pyruvate, water dikinase]-phosphate phosphotransferase / [pyruvate, water dikinase] kinase
VFFPHVINRIITAIIEREMRKIHIYLISDSTGETVTSVARSALAHFEDIVIEEHLWSLLRTKGQIEELSNYLVKEPGIVMYTMVDKKLEKLLKEVCIRLNVPCVSALARVVSDLSSCLDLKKNVRPGSQHELSENYFSRIEAVNFAITHDDGQSTWDLGEADIILVGVSRTSKSPTCIYLAYRGYRTANVPFISGCSLPDSLYAAKKPLIVGLTIGADTLVQIRKNRLLALHESNDTNYVDYFSVKVEIADAKKIFMSNNWPIIDVTKRSVEETSASIIQLCEKKKTAGAHEFL